MAWKIGGGMKTSMFFGLFTSVPILMSFWYLASSFSPRKNEKVNLPGRPVEHYLTFKNPEDKAKYSGRNKIPMETFHEMYFDGLVDFNGDALEVMEYRHDWANFRFTISLFKFFFFTFIPEVITHSRSQGMCNQTPIFLPLLTLSQTRSKSATTTTVVTISTAGSLDLV
jgi:hypothetical protein